MTDPAILNELQEDELARASREAVRRIRHQEANARAAVAIWEPSPCPEDFR